MWNVPLSCFFVSCIAIILVNFNVLHHLDKTTHMPSASPVEPQPPPIEHQVEPQLLPDHEVDNDPSTVGNEGVYCYF